MHRALALAKDGLGQTWPNPSVGAVLVQNGVVIGEARTAKGGRPHAEPLALAQAGSAAKAEIQGATLYVSLEPCAHHGQTPPCTETIIAAKIARVVVACGDPDPRVAGRGVAQLRAAGIEVEEGVCEAEARTLNAGFFRRVTLGLPLCDMKIATSADGFITGQIGTQHWLTGEEARAETHRLRARYDAILTGSGTVLIDNPRLTCRLPGLEDRSPLRVVMDRRLRTPANAAVLPAWIVTGAQQKNTPQAEALRAAGAELIFLPEVTADATLRALAERGITRVLIEAGAAVNTAFYTSGLVQNCYWFRAPVALGAGLQALQLPDFSTIQALERHHATARKTLAQDALTVLELSPCLPA